MSNPHATAGQLFFFNFAGPALTPDVVHFVEETRPGGVVLFSRNLQDAAQIRTLTGDLQRLARRLDLPPLIVAVDEEGGRVTRLPPDLRMLTAPSAMAQAAAGGAPAAAACATATAGLLRRLGFTMNFAPVADVNSNPANPVIGTRSFGADPARVGDCVAAAVTATLAAGIAPCAKHFPGHGDTAVDSHLDLPVVPKTLAELEAADLVPFARAIGAGVPAIMTAHIRYPAADPSGHPATLAPGFLQRLLRERLGFDGLIFTDALGMLAIRARYDLAEATRLALQAGACILAPVGDLATQMACYRALVAAAEAGAFDVATATARVAAHKARFLPPLLAEWESPPAEAEVARATAAEAAALAGVARRGVTLLRNQGNVLPIAPDRVRRPLLVDFDSGSGTQAEDSRQPGAILQTALAAHLPGLRTWAGAAQGAAAAEAEVLGLAAESDLIVLVTRNAARRPEQAALAARLLAAGPPVVLIAAREPYDIEVLPDAPIYVVTYGDPAMSLEALADLLVGRIPPRGRLPVPLPGHFPAGAGLSDFAAPAAAPAPAGSAAPADFLPYTPEQMPALLVIWDAATSGRLPLGPALWRERVDGDPLFQPGDCFILPAPDGTPAGFALTRILPDAELAAHPDLAPQRGRGHLMALAVHPRYARQGIGSRLLAAAEAHLHAQGARMITLDGPSGHLVPGPPVAGGSLPFWQQHGYGGASIHADLRRRLDSWVAPSPPRAVAVGDYAYRQGRPGEEAAILAFLARAFPGRWHYDMGRAFARGYAPGDVTVLCDRAGTIAGFLCTFHPGSAMLGGGALYPATMDPAWGGIGPLGIGPEVRSLGLGLGLVAAGVTYLVGRGVRDCGIDWTGLIAFYGRLGFTVWQAYYQLEKALPGAAAGGGSPSPA